MKYWPHQLGGSRLLNVQGPQQHQPSFQRTYALPRREGEARYSVHRIGKPTEQQKKEALEGLRQLQAKATAAMEAAGKTEDDPMRDILEDD